MGSKLVQLCIASVLVLSASEAVRAQGNEQKQIDELVRKAEAGAPEGGFCATTGWPLGDHLPTFEAFLRSARVGSWKVNTFASGNCELNRVTRVHTENGGKCVTYSYWVCPPGRSCGRSANVECLKPNGEWLSRRSATN